MKRLALTIALLLPAALVGCDAEEDARPDAERIVGAWDVTSANVDVAVFGTTQPIPVLDGQDRARVNFSGDGDEGPLYVLTVTGPIVVEVPNLGDITVLPDGQTVTALGGYRLEGDGRVRFTPNPLGGEPSVSGVTTYRFRGDDRLDLAVENTAEGRALITALLGESVPEELLELIAGGSATLTRAD